RPGARVAGPLPGWSASLTRVTQRRASAGDDGYSTYRRAEAAIDQDADQHGSFRPGCCIRNVRLARSRAARAGLLIPNSQGSSRGPPLEDGTVQLSRSVGETPIGSPLALRGRSIIAGRLGGPP